MLAELFGRWRRNAFVYPVPPAPRTAVLVSWFQDAPHAALIGSAIRVFREGWGIRAAQFEPAALAGTFEQIRELMCWRIPSLTHAVIILERPRHKRLSEIDRERLWRAFRVPVFEQVIGPWGELWAAECEAHDGLHLISPRMPISGEIVHVSPCPCGRKTPRIGVVDGSRMSRRVAAYAR